MSDIWKRSEGKHQWRATPSDFKWWRLSKNQPRLKYRQRNSWYNLVKFIFKIRSNT